MLRRRRHAWGVHRRQDIREPDSSDVPRVSGRVLWHVLPDSREAHGPARSHQPGSTYHSSGHRGKNPQGHLADAGGIHEQESKEKSSIQGKKGGELHGLHVRLGGLPVGHGNPDQTVCGCPAAPIPYRWATSHVARPRTHHEEAEQTPKAEEEKEKEDGGPPASSTKEFDPDCSGHVAQADGVHEQVPKDNRPPSGKKGVTRPQQRPPTKKAPEGAHK
jgi:hypothetical protein